MRNLKFTKHHNHVARKNLLKSRKAKLAATGSPSKSPKRLALRQTTPQKSSWSLTSLLKNVTSYFTGESPAATSPKKRPVRKHPSKKSKKTATSAPATTAAKK